MFDKLSYLVIDTETSGLPKYRGDDGKPVPADHPSQPHVAALAMLYIGPGMVLQKETAMLIKPDGWELEPEAAAVNGLTMERLHAEGVPIAHAADLYTDAIRQDRVVVAFNAQHDCKMMRGELRRLGRDDLFMITKNICAMRGSMGTVVKADGKKGWPKLSDACAHFNIPQQERHTALGDARDAFEVFKHLVRLGVAPEPAVHLAAPVKDAKPARRASKKPDAVAADDDIPA